MPPLKQNSEIFRSYGAQTSQILHPIRDVLIRKRVKPEYFRINEN